MPTERGEALRERIATVLVRPSHNSPDRRSPANERRSFDAIQGLLDDFPRVPNHPARENAHRPSVVTHRLPVVVLRVRVSTSGARRRRTAEAPFVLLRGTLHAPVLTFDPELQCGSSRSTPFRPFRSFLR